MGLGMGLILHSETWYSFDNTIPIYYLQRVESPLKSFLVFLISISILLVSRKLIRHKLKLLLKRTMSLSAPCITFSIFSLWNIAGRTFLIFLRGILRQSIIKSVVMDES